MAGAGTSTDALGFGGYSPALSPNIQHKLNYGMEQVDRNNMI
jgi:hypothetical protein